jgi:hypothetical protein
MAQKSTAAADSDEIARWCKTVLGYLADTGHLPPAHHDYLRKVVSSNQERRNTKGLRQIQRDFQEMIKGLRPDEIAKLDQLLASLGGPTSSEPREEVARILKRGKIDTDDEYQLLMSRIDEIFQDPSKKDEVEAINKLLAASDFE